MLRPDHPALTLDRLRRLADEAATRPSRIEAVRTLSQSPLPGRFAILAQAGRRPRARRVPLRAEAIAGLADDAANQRETLLTLATGEQPVLRREALRDLRGISLTEQRALGATSSQPRRCGIARAAGRLAAAGRLEPRRCPAPAGLPPPTSTPGSARLDGPADPAAGERVFFHSKGPGCYRCHQVNGRGGRAGPDLSTLAAGMDRRRLVESILTPSKEIAPQFVAWSVARTDGTVFTGILLEQSPEGIARLRRRTGPADRGQDRRDCRTQAANDFDHAR